MKFGTILFYLLWPAIWFYAPLVRRVRVYISHNDEILLVKNWFGPNVWQLAGGGIKFGESVLAAAARELEEELGLELPNSAIQTTQEVIIVKQFGLIMRYHVVYWRVSKKPTLHASNDIAETAWIKSGSIKAAPEVAAARNTLKNAIL